MSDTLTIGFVAIGRNEGERFRRCLVSLKSAGERIVYVDSGSSDGSVEYARASGAEVVILDDDKPFTAARARNAGFDTLMKIWSDTEAVLFIDGDCELAEGYVEEAAATLCADPQLGAVTGLCRERFPEATVYNRLCEIEWAGPVGEIDACGGIFMARVDRFRAVGGFDPQVIAAEDDDFCIRLRATGAKIRRIEQDMCFHDADMHHFGQWWRRMVRAGYAFAQVGALHPGYFRAQRLRAWGWGLILPLIAIGGAFVTKGLSLALLLLYPASLIRTRAGLIGSGVAPDHAAMAASFLTLSKFPNLFGMLDYHRKKMSGREIAIVEYK